MAGGSIADKLSLLLAPSSGAIFFSLFIALCVPLALHWIVYRVVSRAGLSTILLAGPSGSGKTALHAFLETGETTQTCISQDPSTVEVSLPLSTETASTQFRSKNDPASQAEKKFLLVDTPGHGKMRHHAMRYVAKPQNIKGIIFVVDAADLASGSAGRREAAEYLYDILLQLQKKFTSTSSTKSIAPLPILIAANKLDLFTALPAALVKTALEEEISQIRRSRAKGLLDSGVTGDLDSGAEKDWLGDGGEGNFEFSQMEESNVHITVEGGAVNTADKPDVTRWWKWIGSQL